MRIQCTDETSISGQLNACYLSLCLVRIERQVCNRKMDEREEEMIGNFCDLLGEPNLSSEIVLKEVETKRSAKPPCRIEIELKDEQPCLERTLALVKPEAVKHIQTIKKLILEAGFHIMQERKVHLTPEQVSELYFQHYGNLYFPLLVAHMSSGPVIALCLTKTNAIEDWKLLMGPKCVKVARVEYPKTLRAKFGDPDDEIRNALHGSDSEEMAEKELHFFFPELLLESTLKGHHPTFYLAEKVNPTLVEGLTAVCKVKPVDPVIWLADWLLTHNPNRPKTNEILSNLPT
ncbi:nucleoside diphosphate kinase homolog 5-like [Schistocerca gregaria]|uniref:nucleoside diphosphate kinase homolog 5-like n=1 Tax=Schistocerca gregaria TaxID=7010 RepID=UPI00211E6C98|nr:nucleoside diphosphate kinase homolog 5-like [Schistocerca gregaria]